MTSPDTQDTEELKPCPFCGARQVIRDEDRPVMMCEHCEAQGPRISFGKPNTMEECWNTRPDSPVTVMVEALTPSAETKATYMGEFTIPWPVVGEDGDDHIIRINVPWTTIKEIMAAIRKYAEASR